MKITHRLFSSVSQSNELLIDVLYVLAFLLHVGWCYYIYFDGIPTSIIAISSWVTLQYASIGFDWPNHWAAFISSAVLSSLILNIVRRVVEGALFGWPRYSANNLQTLSYFAFRAIGYFVLFTLALGAYGALKSSRILDGVGVAFLAVSTFIFGLLVNVIDDFISSCVQVVIKGEKQ